MPDDKKPDRPKPPEKIDNPLPHLAEAMKNLGAMQVFLTKAVDELDVKRQAEYIAACAAFDSYESDAKKKEEEDKKKAEHDNLVREVKRLKKKLESRPCKPDATLHAMAIPAVIERVLAEGDFDKKNLKEFSVICKAWVMPTRAILFKDLNDMKVTSKAHCDGLIELLTARQALCEVVRAITFAFQPEDASVPKAAALRDSLPSPIQWLLLLTMCAEAKKLTFHNMATFGATRIILHHINPRIEKIVLDPKGYAWHGKEVEFGADRERAIFSDWPSLKELSMARVTLKIWAPSHSRGSPRATTICPLTHFTLEKVRINGLLTNLLEGAIGHLTHLQLVQLGSLKLRDLCQVLAEHGSTLTNVVLVGCQITKSSSDGDDDDEDDDGDRRYGKRDPRTARHGMFDRALSMCVNLTTLAIEPGTLPVFQPGVLFRPLVKLETLEFNKKDASSYEINTWISLLGLLPVLAESKRKMKRIHFGHDWDTDDGRLRRIKEAWSRCADKVDIGMMG